MSLFKKTALPPATFTTPPVAPVAANDVEAVKEAARIEVDRLRKKKGSGSTFATGPSNPGFTGARNTLG